jgi:Trypsin-like peptidase domain
MAKPGLVTALIAFGVAIACGVAGGFVLNRTLFAVPSGSGSTAAPPSASGSVVATDQPSGLSAEPTGGIPQPTSSVSDSAPPDYRKAFGQVKSGVVRVLASSCGGLGIGSGFLIDKRTVLTSLAVIGEPAAVVVMIGGKPVAVGLAATDPKRGLAVLRLPDSVSGYVFKPASRTLTAGGWAGVAGLPLAGGAAISSHRVVSTGRTVAGIAGLAIIDGGSDPGAVGAPAIDPAGRLLGMVLIGGGNQQAVVPAAAVVAAFGHPANSDPTPGSCGKPLGPKIPTAVAGDAPAAIKTTLGSYFGSINRGDYDTAYDQLGPAARRFSRAQAAAGWRSSYDFNIRIRAAAGAEAWVTFDSIFAAGRGPAGTSTCARWSLVYTFVESDGKARLNRVEARSGPLYHRC